MLRKTTLYGLALLAAAGLIGCIKFGQVQSISKEEALANQVVGVMESLGEDVMLYESVRGVDEEGEVKTPPQITSSKEQVLDAVQTRQFNEDDVQGFLKEGSAREGNNGLLKYHETEKCRTDLAYAQFVQAIVTEENGNREVIMHRVIEVGEDLTDADLPRLQKVFARRNHDAAEPGVWIQGENGKWRQKPAPAN